MRLRAHVEGDVMLARLPRVRLQHHTARGGDVTIVLRSGCRVWQGLDIEITPGADSTLEIGPQVTVEPGVAIKLRGGRLSIGARTHVREGVLLKAAGDLAIGAGCIVSYGAIVHCSRAVEIGDLVALGERTTVTDSGHDTDGSDVPWPEQPIGPRPVRIGRNSMTFANAVVMRGVSLGANCQVGAGSVVTKGEFPNGSVLAGAPARVIRSAAPAPGGPAAG